MNTNKSRIALKGLKQVQRRRCTAWEIFILRCVLLRFFCRLEGGCGLEIHCGLMISALRSSCSMSDTVQGRQVDLLTNENVHLPDNISMSTVSLSMIDDHRLIFMVDGTREDDFLGRRSFRILVRRRNRAEGKGFHADDQSRKIRLQGRFF